jgi:sugar lactone lactonase YvrE
MGPYGICVDAGGNKYIAQDGTARVRKVNTAGIITTIAGTGSIGFTADGSQATASNLNYPKDVAIDASGNIYIAEHGDGPSSGNGRIRKINAGTGILSTIAGGGASLLDGVAATAAAMSPTRLKFDATYANLYISDLYTSKVRKVNMASGIISTVAGNGTNAYGTEGVAATSTSVSQPDGLAFDAAGNLYVSQQGVYRVSVIKAADSKIYPLAGNGSGGYDGDGIATAHNLYIPFGLAIDASDNLYIAEFGNNLIRRVNLTTGMMTTHAGNTDFGEGGDGGPATNAELSSPIAVATDAEGKVYICNVNGARVRMVGAPACAPL